MGSTKVEAPKPVSYSKSTSETLKSQIKLYPKLYKAEKKYGPKQVKLQLDRLQKAMKGTKGEKGLLFRYKQMGKTISAAERDALRKRTKTEYGLTKKYGKKIARELRRAAGNEKLVKKILSKYGKEAEPALLKSLKREARAARKAGSYERALGSAGGRELEAGRSIFRTELDRDIYGGARELGEAGRETIAGAEAESDLDAAIRARAMERMSEGLTGGEQRNLQQAQRGAWAARGLAPSVPSAISEAMYLTERGEERERLNEQMARGVSAELEGRRLGRYGLGGQMLGQASGLGGQLEEARQRRYAVGAGLTGQAAGQEARDRAFRQSVLGQQAAFQQQRYGRQVGAAQLAQQTAGDPFMALLGRPSGVSGQIPGGMGQMMGFSGGTTFSPESQMAMDIAKQNQSNLLGARSAQAAATGQMWGGLFQGVGSAVGGYLGR